MARLRPHDAEVVGCRDDSFAHELEPDAVDHHARGERVVPGRDPEGEVEPAAPFRDLRRLIRCAEHLHEPTRDGLSRLVDIAPLEKRAVDGLRTIEDTHGERAWTAVLVELVTIGPGR